MKARIKYLDNNKAKITYAGERKDFDRYINKLLFLSSVKVVPAKDIGWILNSDSAEMLKELFELIEENSYSPPPYTLMGKDMKLTPYDYQKEAIYAAINNLETLMVLPCGSGKLLPS